MNTIKIFLAESGRIADVKKDFPLYQGQFNDKLLNVFVPTSILAPQFEIQHYIGQISGAEAPTTEELQLFVEENTYPSREPQDGDIVEFFNTDTQLFWNYTYGADSWEATQVDNFGTFNTIAGTSVKIGLIATKRNGTIYESKSYFMRYLKTATYQVEGEAIEYALYERKLPKEFTSIAGQGENAPTIIANVVNVDTSDKTVTSIITSQTCKLDVMTSSMLDQDEAIESTDFEELQAQVDTLTAEVALKQDKIDDGLTTTSKQVVGAINELDTEVATNTLNIGTNTNDISNIKAEQITQNDNISTNTENISTNTLAINDLDDRVQNLEQQSAVEETYIGRMTGTELPTQAQLTEFVEETALREPQGGDVIIFVQTISGGTDKNYKYTYSRVSQEWSGYEIPATEPASNGSMGIVAGSYNPSNATTLKTQVNIVGGDIKNIYVTDGTDTQRDLHEYLNTDHANLTSTVAQTETNRQNIQTNTNEISTINTTLSKIVTGVTSVGKATKADQDGNGNNIVTTYMTNSAGATKQQLYNYALPRTFNDVSFLSINNEYTDSLPSVVDPIYTLTTSSVGDAQIFYADKTITNAQFQLASKNSYTSTIYVTTSVDCTVSFRLTTQAFVGNNWELLNAELTEPITLTANEIKKLTFASTFNLLESVIDIDDGNIIRQTLEVQTQSSAETTFNVYSNDTYPSSFYLNTTSQTIVVAQGLLGEIPTFEINGTKTSNEISFELPQSFTINDGINALFILSYTGTMDDTTTLKLTQGIQNIQIATPQNYGTVNAATVGDLKTKYASNIDKWVFTGTFNIENSNIMVVADTENVSPLLANYYTKSQADTLLNAKQNNLTQTQLDAVNSGADATKISQIATNTNNISTNTSAISTHSNQIGTLQSNVSTLQTTVGTNTSNITANSQSIVSLQSTSASLQSQVTNQGQSISALGTRMTTAEGNISSIEGKIPAQASSSNQLADKNFVNSTVQTATANFRGNWATWADVPTNASSYPADAQGSKTPTQNDYLVVQDATGYNVSNAGTWRFKYSGDWATDGKNGWLPEYQVNETPLTEQQLAALNSGATTTNIGQIATNTTNIGLNTTAIGVNTNAISGLTTRMGTAEGDITAIKNEQITQNTDISTNTGAISGLTTRMGTAENSINAIPNNYVKYSASQSLDNTQKTQARTNIGAQATITDGSATIASVSNDIVTLKAGVSQSSGAIGNSSGSDISLAKVAKTGVSTDLTDSSDLVRQSALTNLAGRVTTAENDIDAIEGKIPSVASTTNQLADKSYVADLVQTNAAHFRGNWATWNAVPTTATDYPADSNGNKTPTENDYMVVADASGYNVANVGTWRFKYSGKWADDGKNGWLPEYQINEAPMTQAQLDAINSGITSTLVGQITTNKNNITTVTATANSALQPNDNITQLTNNAGYTKVESSSTNGNIKIDGTETTVYTLPNNIATTSDLPIVPTNVSAFTNDSGYQTSSDVSTAINNKAVRYDTNSQGLNSTQQSNARTNIGAGTSNFDGAYSSLTGKPSDGSATIATVSNDVVTLKSGVSQSTLTIGNSNGTDITLAKVAKTGAYSDLSGKPTLGTAAALNTGTSQGDVPLLGAGGKLASSVVPASAITDTFVVSSQAAMLALSNADVGDVCVRTDINKSFILKSTPYSTLSNWQELLTPTDAVQSVNGQTGVVSLSASDVLSTAQQNAVNSGITSSLVTQIGTNQTNISNLNSDKQDKLTITGSSTQPVYVSAAGTVSAGNTYAGGTAVTLNGTDKGSSTASFYAPTSAGTSGYFLKSDGSGAPTWSSISQFPSVSNPSTSPQILKYKGIFSGYGWETISTSPTNESSNLITSGGVYTALGSHSTLSSALLDLVYPVDAIYMSVNSTSPASFLGGTWVQLKDKFLLGAGDTYSNGATGGEATHTLTVDEMPSHNHGIKLAGGSQSGGSGFVNWTTGTYQDYQYTINNTGGGQAHNNMPPYLVVYMWKRTA